ncbi:MAG TPA: POTRA domain-containing protein, partial [Sphingomicrobium sp.]|nr:POTRA domain-containing protein [Sphingomicrobium sp.]
MGQTISIGRFTLGAVHIEGATVFTPASLSPYFEPYLATEVDEKILTDIAGKITDHYRRAGYLLSYAIVPPQSVNAGIVRIVVVEGRIGQVLVEGGGASKSAIEAIVRPLIHGGPLRTKALERTIGLIRDFNGVIVSDVSLARSPYDPAQHTLKILVGRDRARAMFYTDNRGTDPAGRLRFYSSTSLASLVTAGDQLRIDLFAIPGRRYRYVYGQVAASVPLGSDGWKVGVSASAGDNSQRSSGDRIDGRSTNLVAQLSYPIIRGRALTLVGKASLNDWRSVGDLDHDRNQRDRLRVARIGLDIYNEEFTRLTGEIAISHGLGFGKMTRVGDPLASRTDASGRFTKLA